MHLKNAYIYRYIRYILIDILNSKIIISKGYELISLYYKTVRKFKYFFYIKNTNYFILFRKPHTPYVILINYTTLNTYILQPLLFSKIIFYMIYISIIMSSLLLFIINYYIFYISFFFTFYFLLSSFLPFLIFKFSYFSNPLSYIFSYLIQYSVKYKIYFL
jgi:hypothetical protein